MAEISAELIAIERSGLYHVRFRDELIIQRSRNPECDLARALLARGIKGHVRIVDALTGRHRSTVNIEKAAQLTVREDKRRGPCFEKWKPMPEIPRHSAAGEAPAAETPAPVSLASRDIPAAGADTGEGAR